MAHVSGDDQGANQDRGEPLRHLVQINGVNGGSADPEVQAALTELAERLQRAGFDTSVAHALPLADEVAVLQRLAGLEATLQVMPSATPLVGGLITRAKQALHQLVLFYVRDLAAQQNAFNAQTVRIVQRLAQTTSPSNDMPGQKLPDDAPPRP